MCFSFVFVREVLVLCINVFGEADTLGDPLKGRDHRTSSVLRELGKKFVFYFDGSLVDRFESPLLGGSKRHAFHPAYWGRARAL